MKYLKLTNDTTKDNLAVSYSNDTVTYNLSTNIPEYIQQVVDEKIPKNIDLEVQKELKTYTGEATSLEAGANPTCEFDSTNKKVKIGVPKGAATVVQDTGTSTSSVMSQDAATKNFAIGKDIGQPTCVYLSAVNSIELSDKQVELLEARDVISVEICVSNLNRNNNHNKTIAPRYFSIFQAINHQAQVLNVTMTVNQIIEDVELLIDHLTGKIVITE